MSERRTTERRTRSVDLPEIDPRGKDRRSEERRDSPRLPIQFLVRDLTEGGSYEEREGHLSLGGIHWLGKYPPKSTQVEVRFRLAGVPKELRAKGEVIRVSKEGDDLGYHVRFTELDVESELAVARFLQPTTVGS